MKESQPVFFDDPSTRIPAYKLNKRNVWPSKMFTIKLELQEFVKNNPGVPVYDASQGDGGASLGGIPREEVARALHNYLPEKQTTMYGSPVGRQDVREAIFKNYYKFDAGTGLSAENIIIGDGGRDILQKWYQVVQQSCGRYGDVVLVSSAPWGSYLQGPYINGLNIMRAPGNFDDTFKITNNAIDESIEFAKQDDKNIVGLIITTPDNPTGNYMERSEVISIVEHAAASGINHILVDMIYQGVTDLNVGKYDVNGIYNELSPSAKAKVSFLDGLTKIAGASNIRNAHIVCTTEEFVMKMKGVATHTVIPNALGEAAALEVYSHPEPLEHPWVKSIRIPTAESRRIVKDRFTQLGYRFICGQGYYSFVDITSWIGKKIPENEQWNDNDGNKVTHIENVEVLKTYLATRCGLAIIYGSIFGQPDFIRFSYANTPEYTDKAIYRMVEGLSRLI